MRRGAWQRVGCFPHTQRPNTKSMGHKLHAGFPFGGRVSAAWMRSMRGGWVESMRRGWGERGGQHSSHLCQWWLNIQGKPTWHLI